MTTDPRTLLIQGATVVSLDPLIGVVHGGDIVVRDGIIVAVGTAIDVPGAEVLDARGTIAIPGFVDSHVHAWEGQLRGLAPMADFGSYLGLTAFGHGPRYRPSDMYAGTFATALAALDVGITTMVDNAHNALTPAHSEAAIEGAVDAGIRVVHAVGAPFGADLDHVPAIAAQLRDRLSGPLVDVRLFDINPTPELWAFAKGAGMWVSSEIGPHTPGLEARFEHLQRAGLLTEQHALNHCYDLTERTWELIADSGACVNLCPRSDATFGLGSTIPPVRQALRYAAAIGLSNDNEVSYAVNMFAEMQTLILRDRAEQFRLAARGDSARPDALTPAQVLEFATLGGARNAGLSDRVGSLTPGKQADVVLVRADGVPTISAADPITLIVSLAHPGMVDTVLVSGRTRKRNGRLVGIDAEAARATISSSRDYLFDSATAGVRA
ncbi:amidohydrolase family protein [Jatrophihabitans telluris]|uniref:Amidohydrolase family protein n=1 Tax=Jatrophihabitans telluris TaxID=2038343 RepID=A0ABY4QUU6_9ACTN|nr:amidohydrolase family protein [Jatrophihabitans telluris]UQX86887.1 amidohydrolase family protein [Jatrophihabitans telluris]